MNGQNRCYKSLEYNDQSEKIWYTHYRGYIVKSWLCPYTNRIMEEKIPYNQPCNIIRFLDHYFKYDLK